MSSDQNNKTKFKRFIAGLKIGWNKPLLPAKFNAFHNYPIIRIFRVIGGLSVLTVLLNKHILLLSPLKIIILVLASFHLIYIIVINLLMVIYGISRFFSDDLDVKNSPLDAFATLGAKSIYCWKVGCKLGFSGIGIVGAAVIADNVLEGGGNEKVFTPLLGKGLNFFIKGQSVDETYATLNKELQNINNTRKEVD